MFSHDWGKCLKRKACRHWNMARKDNSRHWTDRKTEVLMSICNCQRSASVLLLSFYLSTTSQIHFRQICEMSLRLWCCSTPLGNRLQNTLEGSLIYSSLQMRFKKSSRIPPPLAVTAAIRIFTVDCLFMFLPSSDSQDAVKILIVLMARASWNSVLRCLLTAGCLSCFLKMAVCWHYLFCQ